MKKTFKILGIGLVIAALVAVVSLPGSPVQLVNISRVTPAPAQLPPTVAPATSAAPATLTPRPTETLTPPPTLTPVPTEAPNPYLTILNRLVDDGKLWTQLDVEIREKTPVLIVDFRLRNSEIVSVSVHYNPEMQSHYDRDLGNGWNGANKNGTEYMRLAFAYADSTLPTFLKVNTCKMAYAFYTHTGVPVEGDWEVEMNVGGIGIPKVKADERGFVKMLDVFTADPNFDCDTLSRFAQTPTPAPTATNTP